MGARSRGGGPTVAAGFGLGLALHALFLVLYLRFAPGALGHRLHGHWELAVLGIGLVQLLYLGPLALWCWRRGWRPLVRGLTLLAALTFLLNAGCWGLVLLGQLGTP